MELYFYKLTKVEDPRDYDYQRIFAELKRNNLRTCSADSRFKFEAYTKLVESNFDLPKDDDSWKYIDEPYEYYQDIKSMNQLLAEIEARKMKPELTITPKRHVFLNVDSIEKLIEKLPKSEITTKIKWHIEAIRSWESCIKVDEGFSVD